MNKVFEKIGIIYNPDVLEADKIARQIKGEIFNSDLYSINNMPNDIDLAIIIGGDGTFLKASRHFSKFCVPVLGFNVGRLGYLAQAKPSQLYEVISKLQKNEFEIENRLMLKAHEYTALNDIVVKGINCTRTQTLDLYINDKKLCSYVADGLIIATPTGSTAYSLSAGGPIVSPLIDCFLIVPICPHTLNTRPLIIPTSEKITIKAHEENQKLNISYDGQEELVLDNEVVIEENENFAKMLMLKQQKDRFYDILKEKFNWSLPLKR